MTTKDTQPACVDPMCACRGGPCAECHDGDREKELADALSSLEFYKRRCDALQACQHTMRDPERTMVCDILANGSLLLNGKGKLAAERYLLASPTGAAPSCSPTLTECPKCKADGPLDHADCQLWKGAAPSVAGELPPLPVSHANFYPTATSNDWVPGYTADQMRAYAQAARDGAGERKDAERVPLTEEQIRTGFRSCESESTFKGMTAWRVWVRACGWAERAYGIGVSAIGQEGRT